MRTLVIGGGGREHALAWKVAQSPQIEQVFAAPGNAGTALEPRVENLAIDATDIDGLLDFARREAVALTIIGPEAPLVAGIVDRFSAAGLACFGPCAAAARLEGSKAFAKDFMVRHGIPTARHGTFAEVGPALAFLHALGTPAVVKADGLAAGKGVIVAQTLNEAERAVRDMLAGNAFGQAGHRVVIEEFLVGEEASFIVMADGEHILPLATSQDHKARDDGDQGPNTGGMGAYSPAPAITAEIAERILGEVIQPAIQGMAEAGTPYMGFLYAGLMIAADGTPKVLEFNCRLGDPETQPILLRLRSDLVVLCRAALDGRLDEIEAQWDPRPALGVVMAAGGYPGTYRKGDTIFGLPAETDANEKVFHAGTRRQDSKIITNGGRVLCTTALGDTIADAQKRAYALTERIHWPNAYYRKDIGDKAIQRKR
jgi:phosphoribosylamine--glycine ligase